VRFRGEKAINEVENFGVVRRRDGKFLAVLGASLIRLDYFGFS
jgi:hypothetical protein